MQELDQTQELIQMLKERLNEKDETIATLQATIKNLEAIDVSNLSPIESDFKPCGPEEKNGDCDTVRLATCEYFTTYESTLNGTTTLQVDDESFGSILLIEGNATIENDGTTLEANKGDSVFIDANSGDVKITGNCQWIYSRV